MTEPKAKARAPRLRVVSEADSRPTVRLTPDLHHVVRESIAALASGPCELYQRAAELVTVIRAEAGEGGRLQRAPATPHVRPLTAGTLRPFMTASAYYERYDARQDEWLHARPDKETVSAVLEQGQWSGIRRLEGILEAPAMRPDGSLLQEPGYDAATGYVLVPSAAFPEVREHPTRDDARVALAVLLEPLQDFPHVGEPPAGDRACGPARSAWLAALLTLLARPAIHGSIPAWIFDASTRGSGKSLQSDILAIVATGRSASRMNFPREEEELEKVLGGYALGGDPLIVFDNLVSAFGGGPLDRCLTAVDTVQLRVLGRSAVPTLPWRAVVFASGNNVELKGDTSRRSLVVRLEPRDEHPEARQDFRVPGGADGLRRWCAERRPALVRAALTILRAWHLAGRPLDGVRPWGSFEGWSSLVPPALVWAGAADPLDARPAATGLEEADKGALAAILTYWPLLEAKVEGVPGSSPSGKGVKIRAAVDALYCDAAARRRGDAPPDGLDDLRDAIEALAPPKPGQTPEAGKVGNAFRKLRDRWVGDRQLVAGGTDGGRVAASWTVRTTKQPSSPASADPHT